MKKNVLINLIFYGVFLLSFLVCLIINFTEYAENDFFGILFFSSIAILLTSGWQLKKLLTGESAEGKTNKFGKFILRVLSYIGSAVFVYFFLLGFMDLLTQRNGVLTQNYLRLDGNESVDMLCFGFSFCFAVIANILLKKIKSNDFLNDYGFMSLFLGSLAVLYLLAFIAPIAVLVMITLFVMNFTVLYICLNMICNERFVLPCIILGVFTLLNLIPALASGLVQPGIDVFGYILCASVCTFFYIGLIICIIYILVDELSVFGLHTIFKNKIVLLIIPCVCFILQVLMFYFWQVAASILGIIVVAFFILGLIFHVGSEAKDAVSPGSSGSSSSISLPKKYDGYYDRDEIEDQMRKLQGIYSQIKRWHLAGDVIEVYCDSGDVIYIEKILRKYFKNEIEFHYM